MMKRALAILMTTALAVPSLQRKRLKGSGKNGGRNHLKGI